MAQRSFINMAQRSFINMAPLRVVYKHGPSKGFISDISVRNVYKHGPASIPKLVKSFSRYRCRECLGKSLQLSIVTVTLSI